MCIIQTCQHFDTISILNLFCCVDSKSKNFFHWTLKESKSITGKYSYPSEYHFNVAYLGNLYDPLAQCFSTQLLRKPDVPPINQWVTKNSTIWNVQVIMFQSFVDLKRFKNTVLDTMKNSWRSMGPQLRTYDNEKIIDIITLTLLNFRCN